MTEQARLKEMFGGELAQVDVKAIGKSRGFDAATVASRELMQHGFLSEQGVAAALATLPQPERLSLHLMAGLGEEVDIISIPSSPAIPSSRTSPSNASSSCANRTTNTPFGISMVRRPGYLRKCLKRTPSGVFPARRADPCCWKHALAAANPMRRLWPALGTSPTSKPATSGISQYWPGVRAAPCILRERPRLCVAG